MTSPVGELEMEVSVDGEAMEHYIDGYLAARAETVGDEPLRYVDFDEEFFTKRLSKFCEIVGVKGGESA